MKTFTDDSIADKIGKKSQKIDKEYEKDHYPLSWINSKISGATCAR